MEVKDAYTYNIYNIHIYQWRNYSTSIGRVKIMNSALGLRNL